MNKITLSRTSQMLGIDPKTLRSRMREFGIIPGNSQDKRQRVITQAEFDRLADRVRRPADGVTAEIEQLRAEVAHLQLRVRVLEVAARPGMNPSISVQSVTHPEPSVTRSEASSMPLRPSDGLPGGLVSLNSFCELHGLNVSSVKKAVVTGRLQCHRGSWKVGAARVEYALDEGEQTAVLAMYR